MINRCRVCRRPFMLCNSQVFVSFALFHLRWCVMLTKYTFVEFKISEYGLWTTFLWSVSVDKNTVSELPSLRGCVRRPINEQVNLTYLVKFLPDLSITDYQLVSHVGRVWLQSLSAQSKYIQEELKQIRARNCCFSFLSWSYISRRVKSRDYLETGTSCSRSKKSMTSIALRGEKSHAPLEMMSRKLSEIFRSRW